MSDNEHLGDSLDPILDFLTRAHNMSRQTYGEIRSDSVLGYWYGWLVRLDKLYQTVLGGMLNPPKEATSALPFFYRAHACFLTSIRLAVSGQVYEVYPLVRSCIECAVYGFHVFRKPEAFMAWVGRPRDAASAESARNEFGIGKLWAGLEQVDAGACRRTRELYNLTIECGAHPNVVGVCAMWTVEEDQEETWLKTHYITDDVGGRRDAMMACTQAGLCSLSIFRHVLPERFKLLGVYQGLLEITRDLWQQGRLVIPKPPWPA